MSFKKFFKTVKKHFKEHTRTLHNPKKMYEHLKNPWKDHFRQYQEFTETTVGKVVFAVVSFYVGGIIAGALSGSGGTAAAAGNTAQTTGLASSGGTAAAETSAALTAATEAGATAAGTAGGAVGGATGVTSGVTSGLIQGAGQAGTQIGTQIGAQTTGGFWSSVGNVAKGISTWAKDNPQLTASIASGISQAATPDELDYLNEQERIKQENLARQNKNLEDAGSVNLGLGGAPQPLRDQYGNRVYNDRGGLLRRRPPNTFAPKTQPQGLI